MRRLIVIAASIVTAIALSASPVPAARAQSGWTHIFNFRSGQQGWTLYDPECFPVVPGQWSGAWIAQDTQGWSSCGNGVRYTMFIIALELPEAIEINHLEMHYDYTMGSNPGSGDGLSLGAGPWAFNQFRMNAQGTNVLYSVDQSWTSDKFYITAIASGVYHGGSDPGGNLALYDLTISGPTGDDPFPPSTTDGPYKPVSQADILSLDGALNQFVTTAKNANVHNAVPGQVAIVQNDGPNSNRIVVIGLDGSTSTYTKLKTINAQVGDNVLAGCVLGIAQDNANTSPQGGQIGFVSTASPAGNWPTEWDDSPINTPCNADLFKTLSCLNLNPNFADNGANWNSTPYGVSFANGEFSIGPGATIYQDIPGLDPEEAYYVTLYASAPYVPAETNLEVDIGEANSTLHIAPNQNNQFIKVQTQALTLGNPDFAPDIYQLIIKNPPSPANVTMPPVRVKFACVSTTDPVKAPDACYFDDPKFGADSWEKDGGATYTAGDSGFNAGSAFGGATGYYTIPAEDDIFHAVSISAFSNHAANYTITIDAAAGAGAPIIPPSGRLDVFIRDSDTGELLLDIGTIDLPGLYTTGHFTLPFTLDVSDTYTGDLVIKNISDDITSPGWPVRVYGACLNVEGGIWPGYDNADITGNLFNQDCQRAIIPDAAPSTTEITSWDIEGLGNWLSRLGQWMISWVQYGWGLIHYLIFCILFGIINGVWSTVLGFVKGFALFGVWLGMVISVIAEWARDGFRFLFGGLIASLIPIANTIIGWLLSLPFIQTILDTLSIAGIWLTGFIDLILAILNLFSMGMQMLGAMFALFGSAWQSLITALQASSTYTFTFPDCSNPADPLWDTCIGLETVNFFVQEIPMITIFGTLAAVAVGWRQIQSAWDEVDEALRML